MSRTNGPNERTSALATPTTGRATTTPAPRATSSGPWTDAGSPGISDPGERVVRAAVAAGFRVEPVPGLVPTRRFYGALADRAFLSTQYIRHTSVPFYTPEPDIVHEVIGHGNMLASPRFAAITEAAGQASARLESDEAMQFVADVFWFSIEFGVIAEDGETKAYGAGILSSAGELQYSVASPEPKRIGFDFRNDGFVNAHRQFLSHAADFVADIGSSRIGIARENKADCDLALLLAADGGDDIHPFNACQRIF